MLAAVLLMTVLPAADDDPKELPPGVEVRTHAGADGTEYQHLLVRPAEVEEGRTYPLVVFLHGAGERGSNPVVVSKHFFPAMLRPENRERFPCFILAPQCPQNERWGSIDWRTNADEGAMTAPLAAVKELVDDALEEFPIDRDRLYLTGLSMGGYGTWDWTARDPEFWTAAAPICGGGNVEKAAALTDLPLWVAHGDRDPAVPVERSRTMVAAVSEAGGFPIYVEYPGMGHDVWTTAYGTPEGLVAWMFRQSKADR